MVRVEERRVEEGRMSRWRIAMKSKQEEQGNETKRKGEFRKVSSFSSSFVASLCSLDSRREPDLSCCNQDSYTFSQARVSESCSREGEASPEFPSDSLPREYPSSRTPFPFSPKSTDYNSTLHFYLACLHHY